MRSYVQDIQGAFQPIMLLFIGVHGYMYKNRHPYCMYVLLFVVVAAVHCHKMPIKSFIFIDFINR